MENRTPKHSIARKTTVAIFLVVALFLIQFTGLFFSSQRLLLGLATLHHQQRLSDSILQLQQLTDTLAEIPGRQGTTREDDRKVFESVFEQAERKLSDAKELSRNPEEVPYLDQITKGLEKLSLAARRNLQLPPSVESDRQLLLVRQFSSDIAEGEEKLKLLLEHTSDNLFERVYRIRYQPFIVTIALTLLFVLIALVAGISFKRQLSASIANLLEATQKVAQGNLELRAPVLVRDEIGILTEAFNSMTYELQKSTVSRNYVTAVMQSLPDSLFVLSADGKIERMNKTAGKTYGGDPQILIGKNIQSLFNHKMPTLTAELRDVELTFSSLSGKSIPVSVSTSAIREQSFGISRVVCVMKDLTERKEIEEERRRIAGNQRALADASSILSESVDFDLTLKNVVRAAVPLIGECCFVHIVDKTESLKLSEFGCRDRNASPSFIKDSVLAEAVRTGKPQLVDPEYPDDALYLVCPLIHRDRISGTITVGFFNLDRRFDRRDIALIEEFSRRAAIALENSRLYHEAQEAILSRDEFLSIASHELKTPLTSLSLQLQILNREIQKYQKANPNQLTVSIPARTLKIIASSEVQSSKLAALLDELLDLTRIRLGKLELAKEDVDLGRVIKGVVDRFKVETAQKQIAIRVEVEDSVIGCWDLIRIEQVVSNLISNAVKYGGGSAISIRGFRVDGVARLVVADRGMGIPHEMLDKIFERFERAGVSGRKISGLGLGLYICRQIVEAHGGSIRVESELGKGSSFTVDFPLTLAAGTKLVS